MSIPSDYSERVYAGVLGKLIGVYLGRPFEGWTYEMLNDQFGEINYYVHEHLDVPLIVTDDDISGTFTFLRALPDYGNSRAVTAAQIGQSWLNYIIEERTILWWGGMGNSTEHTAYLRLKEGIPAPDSGSMALNGQVVAEQIGAQIFIDGWAMVAPGDPELAADLARRAASVSHDGAAIHGAQVLAAMEAQAFVESDIQALIDTGLSVIPEDSLIRAMISQIREWHARHGDDWRATREEIAANFGYDKFGGNCHMVPNHALIIHALLHGEDSFQKSLMIVNTSGWDTDCNSGNVGCLLGIKNGLAGLEDGPDFRGPLSDRLYLPTADGGRAVTDAVTESLNVANIGRAMSQAPAHAPKDGARYHFELPGSVQGFMADESVDSRGTLTLENVAGHSRSGGRSLALRFNGVAAGRPARAATHTFIPSKETAVYFEQRGYGLLASPSIYPGQTVSAAVEADPGNERAVDANLYLRRYRSQDDQLTLEAGPSQRLEPGANHTFNWTVDGEGNEPIAEIGVAVQSDERTQGTIYLDYLTWKGEPDVTFTRPDAPLDRRRLGTSIPQMWRRAWVNGVDSYDFWWPESFRLVQNRGRGLLSTGTREWRAYEVKSEITLHLCSSAGIAARVQGMRRYYALLLSRSEEGRGVARVVRALDGDTVLAEADFPWNYGEKHTFALRVEGDRLRGCIDDLEGPLFDVTDSMLDSGGIALVVEEGRVMSDEVTVCPA
ncbi:MAG: ADP-ribosylglycohydrolase family protein [Caldilineaceae bacterium SB0661_bin_32]|uniref:ADP-ribosylglycohydrolase family protein n=1 Tax=Caldilineaceae bacterium SB0661_bin_32 TaxID=2605255 RepID=A0A6B1D3N0_9CHLR|nr:ADP-ribosylglycohydrolase family protein [Caldilineaceae bacterium SB0661_bin_32]